MTTDRYLPALDGWRAVAITMVVLSHSLTTESESAGSAVNLLLFRLGTFGVMLFFAISGFLILYPAPRGEGIHRPHFAALLLYPAGIPDSAGRLCLSGRDRRNHGYRLAGSSGRRVFLW